MIDQLGFCSWSVRPKSVEDLIAAARQIGLNRLQLSLNPLSTAPDAWADCFAKLRDAGLQITGGMVGCFGEDYTSIESIRRTGGVVPDETWPRSQINMQRAAEFASAGSVRAVTFHAGFIPADRDDLIYKKVVQRVRYAADLFAQQGVNIALETGQEPAGTLQRFLRDVERDTVGVNFDPANMLMYGSGDPIAALRLLLPQVRSCHIKDANASPAAGVWGTEEPVGTGQVAWPAFFGVLRNSSFTGPLLIERERGDQRVADIKRAKEFVMTSFA